MTNEAGQSPLRALGHQVEDNGSCELLGRNTQPGKNSLSFWSKKNWERREAWRGQMWFPNKWGNNEVIVGQSEWRMELELRKGKRKDPWGTESATFLYPAWDSENGSEQASWGPTLLSVNLCLPNFPLCSFQCAWENVPMRLADSPPWEVGSLPTGPCLPESYPTSTRFLDAPWPLAGGSLFLTSACHKTLTHWQTQLPESLRESYPSHPWQGAIQPPLEHFQKQGTPLPHKAAILIRGSLSF